ncbi:hypothetical protein [Dyadobacter arcticus]|uniref:Uncharacterized protein n=1 Tax=Dyadobacter arcticus TaxID=1078754 RepID=A0ABX0US47_9BACT|nr:hypothetical protein [Dyadobacter arcticus]NIJ55019.1 hypothetical protein [Dyadobacter arcticus]
MAYGEKVKELLSASSPDAWCDHLWAMYGGYVLAQKELGYSADATNVYWSFRDLLFFFEGLPEKKMNERMSE